MRKTLIFFQLNYFSFKLEGGMVVVNPDIMMGPVISPTLNANISTINTPR
ncbi:hypothetical protein SLEP1_g37213 [Rubroshorea leprosula]|uniref:Uncharacterized protein n=1 Tax=Rubroshorea leprosula TaxID=152421 RepID=A0AAV5KU72_9ROSI|nr:hypothetical protein SLEP1_g37213 [Rubroshorea leprosula]